MKEKNSGAPTPAPRRIFVVCALLLTFVTVQAVPASAYETGAMSCDDVGRYAASVVEGKQKGMTERKALAAIQKTVPSIYASETRILKDIVRQIYTAAYAIHLTPDGAFAAYKADCAIQQ